MEEDLELGYVLSQAAELFFFEEEGGGDNGEHGQKPKEPKNSGQPGKELSSEQGVAPDAVTSDGTEEDGEYADSREEREEKGENGQWRRASRGSGDHGDFARASIFCQIVSDKFGVFVVGIGLRGLRHWHFLGAGGDSCFFGESACFGGRGW